MKTTVVTFFFVFLINQLWSQKIYYECLDFTKMKGHCIVQSNNKFGVVKNNKNVVVPIEFDTLYEYDFAGTKNYYMVKSNNNYGLYNDMGKQLIATLYDKIEGVYDESLNQDFFHITSNNKKYILLDKNLDKLNGAFKVTDNLFMGYYEVSVAEWIFFIEDVILNKRLPNIRLEELLPDTNKINSKTLPYIKAYACNVEKKCVVKKTYSLIKQHTVQYNLPCVLNSDINIKKLGNFPITGITHYQAKLYCEWLSRVYNTLILNNSNLQLLFRLPNKNEWEEIAYSGLIESMKKNNLRDSINTKGCFLFNYNVTFPCESYSKMIKERGVELVYVSDFYPDYNGLVNLFGNVSEMLLEKGLCKGGNYTMYAKDCAITNTQTYSRPEPWLGFRWVAELTLKEK